MNPRVLLDARFRPALKGGDRYRYELLQELAKCDDIDVVPLVVEESEHLVSGRRLTTRVGTEQHPRAEIFEHVTLPRLVQRGQFDLYHGTFQVLPAAMTRRTRTVLTVHDTALHDRPELFSRQFAAIARPQFAASVRRADHIICVTETTRLRLEELYPRTVGRTTAILNGVSREFSHRPDPAEVEQTLTRLRIPQPYVLFVGNLEPKKNLPRLLAAHQLTPDLPHSLVIVGSRPSGTRSDELAGAGSRVHHTGRVDETDLLGLYAGADLLAYPSTYEGFGMPVLEGMASGVPVLTSSVSCLPEVAGGAALLVDPFDIDSIAEGLRRGLTDEGWRRSAVEQGLARAAALTWSANAEATAQVYRELT